MFWSVRFPRGALVPDELRARWLRDDKYAGKWDESLTTAVPKSGSPYVVRRTLQG